MIEELTEEQEQLVISELDSVDVDDKYEDMLDSFNQSIFICGIEFEPSRILRELDPTAYSCGLNDWLDSEEFVKVNGSYYNKDDVEELLEDA